MKFLFILILCLDLGGMGWPGHVLSLESSPPYYKVGDERLSQGEVGVGFPVAADPVDFLLGALQQQLVQIGAIRGFKLPGLWHWFFQRRRRPRAERTDCRYLAMVSESFGTGSFARVSSFSKVLDLVDKNTECCCGYIYQDTSRISQKS